MKQGRRAAGYLLALKSACCWLSALRSSSCKGALLAVPGSDARHRELDYAWVGQRPLCQVMQMDTVSSLHCAQRLLQLQLQLSAPFQA